MNSYLKLVILRSMKTKIRYQTNFDVLLAFTSQIVVNIELLNVGFLRCTVITRYYFKMYYYIINKMCIIEYKRRHTF